MKYILFLLFLSSAVYAQFPWQPAPVSQWLSTNNLGGVTAGYYAGAQSPDSDAIRLGFFASAAPEAVLLSGVAIGRHAGYAANGQQSVFIGHAAGQYAGKGGDASSSVVLGYLAGRNATQFSPHYEYLSVVIGTQAAHNTHSAQTGVIIGAYAANNAINSVGAVIVGFGAGYNATNANGSVILGQYAGYNATNAANSILIGNRAGRDLSNNYQLVIDSNEAYSAAGTTGLIYGDCWNRVLKFNANSIGFFGGSPVAKPVVTGSISNGQAIQSLINALKALNLIDNQTTP